MSVPWCVTVFPVLLHNVRKSAVVVMDHGKQKRRKVCLGYFNVGKKKKISDVGAN